jgi:hypothetical protein
MGQDGKDAASNFAARDCRHRPGTNFRRCGEVRELNGSVHSQSGFWMGPRTREQRLAVGIWSQPKQHCDSCCDSCVTVHPLIRQPACLCNGRAFASGKCEVIIHLPEGRLTGDVVRLVALTNCAGITGHPEAIVENRRGC